jgi:AGZA family xanthine/uracil permease-like MFS transporter
MNSSWLDRFFCVTSRGSSFRTELLAGISTYLSLAYILIVNPAILSKGGFDSSSVLFATAVASGLSCILMGLWARLPFALAPGLEMNGFVAFSAIGLMGLSVEQSLGAVFWSGVLCILLTWLPMRQRIIDSIPSGLQSNLAFSVGIFVVTIALYLSKIVVFENGLPAGFGSLTSPEAVALYIGLASCCIFRSRFMGYHTPILSGAAFLLAICASTAYCRSNGITAGAPPEFSSSMLNSLGGLSLMPFTSPAALTVFLVLFLIDFYGSIGKFIGLTASTNLRSKDSGVVGLQKAMYVDGIGTVGGALLGTTSIITYVESAIGIHAGGRTGIVAIVCGLLMLASLLFTPLVALVPAVATSGVLVFVGYALLPREQVRSGEFTTFDVIVGLLMAVVSFATFSLDKAMLVGFAAYSLRPAIKGNESMNPYLVGSFLLLLISVSVQFLFRS